MTTNIGSSNKVIQTLAATVATGATASNAIEIGGYVLGSIYVPSTFDGTTFSIQASIDDGTTWADVYLDGSGSVTQVVFTPGGTNRFIAFDTYAAAIACHHKIRIVCGSTQTTSDTVFKVLLKRTV